MPWDTTPITQICGFSRVCEVKAIILSEGTTGHRGSSGASSNTAPVHHRNSLYFLSFHASCCFDDGYSKNLRIHTCMYKWANKAGNHSTFEGEGFACPKKRFVAGCNAVVNQRRRRKISSIWHFWSLKFGVLTFSTPTLIPSNKNDF